MKATIWTRHNTESNLETFLENNSSIECHSDIERERYLSSCEVKIASNIPKFLRSVSHVAGVVKILSERGEVITPAGELILSRIPTNGEANALKEIAFQQVFFSRGTFSATEVGNMGGYDTLRKLEEKGWVFLTRLQSGALSVSTFLQTEQGF